MNKLRVVLVTGLVLAMLPVAWAQSSASYRLSDYTFNAGGLPGPGVDPSSPSYHLGLAAVGDGIAVPLLSSGSYDLGAGMVTCYPAPGEVAALRFVDEETLVWDPESSWGSYNLYRDLLGNLSSLGYGLCEQYDLAEETTTDSDVPAGGQGYFYLVTAENMLDEEGSRGEDSFGGDRGDADACP